MENDILEQIRSINTNLSVYNKESKTKNVRTKESRNIQILKGDTFNNKGWAEPITDDFDTYRTFYMKYPVVKHKIDTTSNFIVSRGFSIDGEDEISRDIVTDEVDNVNSRTLLQSIATILQIDGNCFMNPKFSLKKLTNIDILDAKYMRVVPKYKMVDGKKYPILGSIAGYVAVVGGKVVKRYTAKEIIHIKHNVYGTNFYGISDLEAIKESLQTKHGIEQDVAEAIFRNASPLILWSVGDAKLNMLPSSAAISEFAQSIEDRDPGEDVFANDLVKAEVVSFNPANLDTAELVKHFDRETRLGFSESFTHGDGGNRSSGDIHVEIYHMNVKAFQQEIGDQLQLQLFRKILDMNNIDMMEKPMKERPFIKFNDMRAEDRKEQAIRFRLYTDAGMSKKTAMKIVGMEEFIAEEEINSKEQEAQEMDKLEKMSKFTNNDQNGEKDGKDKKTDKKAGDKKDSK